LPQKSAIFEEQLSCCGSPPRHQLGVFTNWRRNVERLKKKLDPRFREDDGAG
jgi:hypothetical protein